MDTFMNNTGSKSSKCVLGQFILQTVATLNWQKDPHCFINLYIFFKFVKLYFAFTFISNVEKHYYPLQSAFPILFIF